MVTGEAITAVVWREDLARGSGAVVDDVFEVLESQEVLTCDVAWLVKYCRL